MELNSIFSGNASRTIKRMIFAIKPLIAYPSMMAPICVEGIIPPREKVEVYTIPSLSPIMIINTFPIQNAISGSKYSIINGNGIMKIALTR